MSGNTPEPDAQIMAIWNDALEQYAQTVGRRLDDVTMPLPNSATSLLAEIDKQQNSFSEYRARKHKLFEVLGFSLKPVELLGNLAAGGTSMAFPPSSLVFGAVSYLIDAGHGVSASYDAIITLFDEIKGFTTRLTVHAKRDIPQELKGVVVEILATLVKICGLSAKLISRGRLGHFAKTVLLGRDDKVQAELANLARLTESEQRMVGALTLQVSGETRDLAKEQRDLLLKYQEEVRELLRLQIPSLNQDKKDEKADTERKQLEIIRGVLEPSSKPQELLTGITSKRLDGTGDWIREEPMFKSWVQREKPVLWLSGGPGTGKSYLASNIIQYLMQLLPQGRLDYPGVVIGYFFCKDYDPSLRLFTNVLRTFAYQICRSDFTYAKYVAAVCSFPEDIVSTEMIWRKLFIQFFSDDAYSSTVYLVLDGLDEAFAGERVRFLELLKIFQGDPAMRRKLRIQIVMLGRPELNHDIDQVLDDEIPVIELSKWTTSHDIDRFIKIKVWKSKSLSRVSKTLKQEIVSTLSAGAQGMFLWADLMLNEIAAKGREAQIRQALKTCPKGLFNTIRHVLDRFSTELNEDDISDLNELLAWALTASRFLSLSMVAEILKVKSGDNEGMIDLEGRLRKRYASLFELIRDDGRTTQDLQLDNDPDGEWVESDKIDRHDDQEYDEDVDPEGDLVGEDCYQGTWSSSTPRTTIFTFAHSSFGDFFRQEGNIIPTAVGVDLLSSRIRVTKSLLSMICDDAWAERDNDLLCYAIEYWCNHLASIDPHHVDHKDKQFIGEKLVLIFRCEKVLRRWLVGCVFRDEWIYRRENFDTIRRWFADIEIRDHFREEDKMWVESLDPHSENPFLDTMLLLWQKEWLQDPHPTWDVVSLFADLYAYFLLIETREKDSQLPIDEIDLADLTATKVKEFARRYRFEEDALWYCRVADILAYAGKHDEAQTEYLVAREMDERCWPAHSGLARELHHQEDWQGAIQAMGRSLSILQQEMSPMDVSEYSLNKHELSSWYAATGNKARALELNLEIHRAWPQDFGGEYIVRGIIDSLVEQGKHADVVELLYELEGELDPRKINNTRNSRLTNVCIETALEHGHFMDYVGASILDCGNVDFLINMYKTAIKATAKEGRTGETAFLQFDLGYIWRWYMRDEGKAVQVWTSLVNMSAWERKDISAPRDLAVDELCLISVNKAVAIGKKSSEATDCVRKLQWLTRDGKNEDDKMDLSAFYYKKQNNTLSLGLVQRLYGDEKEARKIFQSHVRLGVKLLSDSDRSNDWQGLIKLGMTFKMAGDYTNAVAAWMVYGSRWVHDQDDDEDGDVAEDCETAKYADSAVQGDLTGAAEHLELSNPEVTELDITEGVMDGDGAGKQLDLQDSRKGPADIAHSGDSPVILSEGGDEEADYDELSADGLHKFKYIGDYKNRGDDVVTWLYCNGPCGRPFAHFSDANFCRYCLDILLCGPCLEHFRKGQMRFCNPDHKFFRPPLSKGGVPKGMVKVGDQIIPWAVWLDGIKQKWEL